MVVTSLKYGLRPPYVIQLFKTYAEFMDETLSTLFKKALLEKIEDEFDLKVGQKALAEYEQDPVTYSVAEMRAKYGL